MIVGILSAVGAIIALAWALLMAHVGQGRARKASNPIAEIQREQQSRTIDDNLFEHAPSGLCQLALDGRILRANGELQALCGFDEQQLHAYCLPHLLHSDDVGAVTVILNELSSGNGNTRDLRCRLLHANGHCVWLHLSIRLIRSRSKPIHFLAAMTDIGEYVLAEQITHNEHTKFASIAAYIPVAVWLLSPECQIIFANNALETLTGRRRESFFVNPRSYFELIHPDDLEAVRQVTQFLRAENYEINYRILRDDGDMRYIRQLSRGVYDDHGKLLYFVASATDISSEMIARDELHELNSRLRETNFCLRESVRLDGLTRCLNRIALFEEAEKALLLTRRYQRSSTVIFFDLNNFKEINDSFGHHIGDRALITFAEQIKARLRTTDELGRYGGDEFVALLRETDAEQAMQLLSTLPAVVVDNDDGSSIILRFSAGVACSSDDGIESVDDWLRIADGLMYRQKTRVLKDCSGRS